MAVRVAINGFGRIGRLVYRALLEKNMLDGKVEVVVVNDLVPADNLAYLLKYDSFHGQYPEEVKALDANTIQVGDRTLKTIAMKANPNELPWKDYNVDVVIEATGRFTKRADASGHITAGAKKVIISAPSDADVKTILIGVNNDHYQNDDIISCASCTTNCLAPVVHVLIKEGIGVEEGLMSTLHAYTASQALVDGQAKGDLREQRAAAQNIIPTTSGSAKMIGVVIPEVKGKLTGMAFRVPVPVSSIIDLTFKPTRETSLEEINAAMKKASQTYLKGILDYTEDEVVSSDFIHNSHSAIYDAKAGIELNSRFFKISAWYDNEWGFSCRMVDLLDLVVTQNGRG